MGAARIRTMWDISRVDGQLGVKCGNRRCGRAVIYQLSGMLQWFQHKNWNTDLEVAGSRFRCEVCGHRGAILSPAHPSVLPAPPAPVKLGERDLQAEARRRRG